MINTTSGYDARRQFSYRSLPIPRIKCTCRLLTGATQLWPPEPPSSALVSNLGPGRAPTGQQNLLEGTESSLGQDTRNGKVWAFSSLRSGVGNLWHAAE